MPTVTLNKEVFESLVGKKLPLEELKDRISMLGTDLEKIEGNEIEVEVFPNRPDLLSEQGFARAFSSFIGVKTGLRKYDVKKSGYKVIVDSSVNMRPYTACAIVRNLNLTDEIIRETMQMQEKLATTHGRNRKKSAYGVYPIANVTFPIMYVAKDPKTVMFQPLGFSKKIPAHLVEEQHPTGPKFKHIAAGWKKYPFFIDAKENVMCMLPYTNSDDTGKVDLTTKEVFIECTGNDLDNVTKALHMFVTMFADMGGTIFSLDIEYPNRTTTTPNLTPERMTLDLPYINKRLGLTLSEKHAQELLERMGYGYEKRETRKAEGKGGKEEGGREGGKEGEVGERGGVVLIPAYRADILHQVDLMEDIAIAYGYENFVEEIPNVSTIGEEDHFEKFARKVREILTGLGVMEAKNFHLMTSDELNEKMNLQEEIIPLKNALGEYNHLRNSLLPSLMKNLKDNQHHEYPQNIFEIGRTFTYGETETGVLEREHLAIVVCHEKADFTELKQILEGLLTALGLELGIKETSHPSYIEGRAGNISVLGGVSGSVQHGAQDGIQHSAQTKTIGIIGETSPQVISNWTLAVPIVAVELDLEALFSLVKPVG